MEYNGILKGFMNNEIPLNISRLNIGQTTAFIRNKGVFIYIYNRL